MFQRYILYFKSKMKLIPQNFVLNTWFLDSSTSIGGEENSRRGLCEDVDYLRRQLWGVVF